MAIRVIVNGALGKMGSLACETLKNHPDFLLVAELTKSDNLKEAITQTEAQVVVDLTRADCVYANARTIIEQGAHPVIGSSGLQDDQIAFLRLACDAKRKGGIIVPNFSIAAVLMMRFSEQASRYFSWSEIIESHHPQKYDAPSGTALKTAEMISKMRKYIPDEPSRETVGHVRGGKHQGVTIHSLRLPGILARQEVIFGERGETLSIKHDSIDRISFMPGLVLCCQKVMNLDSLYYGLEHLL